MDGIRETYPLGIYVKILRNAADMTQDELAEKIGIKRRQLQRFEGGTSETGAAELVRAVGILGGAWEHVMRLTPQPGATESELRALGEEAERLAMELTDVESRPVDSALSSLSDTEIQQLAQRLDDVRRSGEEASSTLDQIARLLRIRR